MTEPLSPRGKGRMGWWGGFRVGSDGKRSSLWRRSQILWPSSRFNWWIFVFLMSRSHWLHPVIIKKWSKILLLGLKCRRRKIPVRSSDHELLIVLTVGVCLVSVHVRRHRVTGSWNWSWKKKTETMHDQQTDSTIKWPNDNVKWSQTQRTRYSQNITILLIMKH